MTSHPNRGRKPAPKTKAKRITKKPASRKPTGLLLVEIASASLLPSVEMPATETPTSALLPPNEWT